MERISVEQLSRIGLIDFFSSICSQPKKSKTPLLSAPEAVPPNESNVDTTATLPITIEQALLIRTGCLNNYFWVRGIFPNVTRTCHSEVWYRRDKSRYNALPCSNNCEGSNQIYRNHRFTRPIMQSYLHGRSIADISFFLPCLRHRVLPSHFYTTNSKLPDFFAVNAPVAIQIIRTVLASYRNRHLSFHNDAAGIVFANQEDYVLHGWHVHRFLHVRHSTFNDRICHIGTAPGRKTTLSATDGRNLPLAVQTL